jgi:hypothetical protein
MVEKFIITLRKLNYKSEKETRCSGSEINTEDSSVMENLCQGLESAHKN